MVIRHKDIFLRRRTYFDEGAYELFHIVQPRVPLNDVSLHRDYLHNESGWLQHNGTFSENLIGGTSMRIEKKAY